MNSIVERIDSEIEKHSLLKHPFYQMWSEGKLTVEHLQGYSKEYFQLVKAVPGIVENIARSSDSSVKPMVLANAVEEHEHIELWTRFAKSVGVSGQELAQFEGAEKTDSAVSMLQNLSCLPVEQAAAAMYAYEAELPKISRSKIDGLCKFYGMSSDDATKYFREHEEADVRHAQLWRQVLGGADESTYEAVMQSAVKSLEAQNKLLDSIYERYVGESVRC